MTKQKSAATRRAKPSDRLLDLIALLSLTALCACVFLIAGGTELPAITGVAAELYAVWRGRHVTR